MLVIIAAVISLIGIGVSALQYLGGRWLLAQEKRNFELFSEKSKLNCYALPIHCAVRDKNLAVLKGIAQGDDRFESLDGWSRTPLYFAITRADKEAVEILLDKGASPNVFDDYGEPALLISVRMKQYEVVEVLLKHGAQVDAEVRSDSPLFNPLDYCVTNNDLKCVELLLKHGASVDKMSKHDVIINKIWVKKISIYEMAMDSSNVSAEIKRLLEKSHMSNRKQVRRHHF